MLHMINPDYELIGAASDDQEGMELIRKKRPDLVIIDIDVSGEAGDWRYLKICVRKGIPVK
ncbi:MAG: hypothetical protein V8S08_04655 [Lachnoclostridium sp.]